MQTSKTDHVVNERKQDLLWTLEGRCGWVSSTSSAHIAVDGWKHYLHYKHFSTPEIVTGENWSKFLLQMTLQEFWNHTLMWHPQNQNKTLQVGEQAGHHQFCIDLHNSSILVVQLCKTSRELQDIWAQLEIENGLVVHITAPYARRST